ncbi:lysophospholipid acyltransferase family protein [Corynebacterium sp. LK2510]|uniref:lysophospholipid acyltransferase family protein n=1 Tax=Corynebacterium sp. LK2510 TaxID=3110472 RepID=UPI0034CD31A9
MSVDKALFVVEPGYAPPSHHATESGERFYQRVIRVAKGLFRAQGTRTTIYGLEHLPREGGALIAANHTGWFDFIFAGMGPHINGRRLVRFMAKKEVFELPVIGWLMRSMHHVPVDRSAGAASIDDAVAFLQAGELVGIFPEGTISRSFELADFKTGGARIAQRAGVPLIPCAIWGSQRLWTKDLPRRMGRSKTPVIVRYGAPVPTEGTPEEVTARLKEAIAELLDASRAEYSDTFGPFEPGEKWMPQSLGGGAPTLEEAEAIYQREKQARAEKKKNR